MLMSIGGQFVALELKKDEREVPDAIQMHTLELIAGAGGIGMICHPQNWEDTFKYLQKIAKRNGNKPAHKGELIQ